MHIASISEAKNTLSALLDRVRSGETVVIVDRGRPVARLEPALSSAEPHDGRLARLERAGLVGRSSRATKIPLTGKPPRPRKVGKALEALLQERGEGR